MLIRVIRVIRVIRGKTNPEAKLRGILLIKNLKLGLTAFLLKKGQVEGITGGLSFNIHASYNIVHNQVYLPKGGATEQEILTRRRQLQTNFEYYFGFGINYRFGSNLNNFINPRFDGPNN